MSLSHNENCLFLNAQDMLADLNAQPFMQGGALMIPAEMTRAGITSQEGDDAQFVSIMLSLGVAGLFVSYTSEGARMFAAKLVEMADMVDADVAKQVDEVIAKARGAK